MNKNYVKELTSMWYTTWVKDEMYEYTAKVNQTPRTVSYEKEQFPEELVISMENLICQPLDREFDKAWYSNEDYEFEDTSYAREMNRLGAKDTALTVEKIRNTAREYSVTGTMWGRSGFFLYATRAALPGSGRSIRQDCGQTEALRLSIIFRQETLDTEE